MFIAKIDVGFIFHSFAYDTPFSRVLDEGTALEPQFGPALRIWTPRQLISARLALQASGPGPSQATFYGN
jgi:hypothetical protein